MARFKDFGSAEGSSAEPISFKINGEEFTCIPEIPGKTVLNLVAKSSGDDPSKSADAVTGFFDIVLTAESRERFNALAEDPDRIVTMKNLTDIIEWLVEQYTDRPTVRPEALPSGQ